MTKLLYSSSKAPGYAVEAARGHLRGLQKERGLRRDSIVLNLIEGKEFKEEIIHKRGKTSHGLTFGILKFDFWSSQIKVKLPTGHLVTQFRRGRLFSNKIYALFNSALSSSL